MDVTNSNRTAHIMTVPMHLPSSSEARIQILSKLTPASVGIHTEEDDTDVMGSQYIPLNVQRVSDQLASKVLGSDALHGQLLTHQVVDLAGTDFVHHSLPAQYYDTEDILSQEDLTEDDRRLAAALVAVQFVQHQKQQQQPSVLSSDLLGTKPIVNLPSVSIDKPVTAMIPVTNYMQAVPDDSVHHLIDHHNQESIMKIYHNHAAQQVSNYLTVGLNYSLMLTANFNYLGLSKVGLFHPKVAQKINK